MNERYVLVLTAAERRSLLERLANGASTGLAEALSTAEPLGTKRALLLTPSEARNVERAAESALAGDEGAAVDFFHGRTSALAAARRGLDGLRVVGYTGNAPAIVTTERPSRAGSASDDGDRHTDP